VPVVPGAEPFSADGNRVGVLLAHGFTGSPASMRPWGEHLAAQGFTVRIPRLPGHGTRWQDMNLTKWEDWYGEAEAALDELLGRCETVFVMGLSMGGTLTLRLAEQRPSDIRGIVLVNASIHNENKALPALPLVKLAVPALKAIANDIAKPGVDEVAYPKTPLRALASLVKLWRLTKADLGKVTMPVLMFRSATDHVVEPSNAVEIRARIGSDDVREVVLPNSYHVATLDYDAQVIFDGSVEFVRQHAGIEA
jgi:carboxylesterase